MKTMINITTSIYDIERYRNLSHLREFYRRFGCDGYELMRCPPPSSDILGKEDVVGVHLAYFTSWIDFWLGDEEALLEEYGSRERYEAFYGGTSRERIVEFVRSELEFAAGKEAEYVVFHAGDSVSREVFTYRFRHRDEEIVDAVAEIVNLALEGTDYSFWFLVENLPWPGMRFTRPEITERLLGQIRYEKKGIMLDTGHLMCTNPDIVSEEEGIAYIRRCLDAHGPLCRYIKGVHLHRSLSGSYVKSVLADPPVLPDDYDERIGMAYMHVFRIDQHQPFSCKEVKELIRQINPEYLTHEFVTNDLAQHEEYLRVQVEALAASLNQPNSETVAAMLEAERIAKDPSVKGYTDLDELFADLKV
ncbi:MAG: TIM barrel protein [Lachnospiraceae bacterium]|nr:TIM barrel protein [Lachnospiraceae bacterium]